jgi:hypothetical protein
MLVMARDPGDFDLSELDSSSKSLEGTANGSMPDSRLFFDARMAAAFAGFKPA